MISATLCHLIGSPLARYEPGVELLQVELGEVAVPEQRRRQAEPVGVEVETLGHLQGEEEEGNLLWAQVTSSMSICWVSTVNFRVSFIFLALKYLGGSKMQYSELSPITPW